MPPQPTAQLYGLTLDADSCCDATWLTLDYSVPSARAVTFLVMTGLAS